uniref:Uncharacterized protein n=1 Tax=Vespula pensylvanica TaxID=30213 RepID=A0A834MX25_VESPE|nr:hypothetical protein H0235_018432 [Vespula pensylvanica]
MSPVEELEDLKEVKVALARELAKFPDFSLYFIAVLSSEEVREAICESSDVPEEYKNCASKTVDCLECSTKSFASLANAEIIHYSKIHQGTSSDLRRKSEGLVVAKGSSAARIDNSHKKIPVASLRVLAKFPDFRLYFIAVLSSEEVREAICESSDVPEKYKNYASKIVDCLESSTKSFGSSWSIYDYKNYGFGKIGFIKTASLANAEIIHYSKIHRGTSSDLRRKSEGLVAAKGSSAARIDASHKMLSSEEVREAICESSDVSKEYKNCAFKIVDCLESSTKSFEFQLAERKSSPLVLPPFDRSQLSSKSSNWSAGDVIDI